jgi:demethylmenaquinone methyltransferase/2-methoxy-6-polyprenyl-1,4-benzoquinol methylase
LLTEKIACLEAFIPAKENGTEELSSQRVYAIFSFIAKKYERFNLLSSMGFYKTWLRAMVRCAPIDSHSDVLDIASGTGDVAFRIASTKNPRHIQITDFVPEMLEIAKQHDREGAARGVAVDFDIVDAQNIPYADNSYDVVTVAYGIRNMPDRQRALAEMYRVLKPGGSLICLEFSTPTNVVSRNFYKFYLTYMIPFWGKLLTKDKESFVYLSESIVAFPSQQEFAHMFEKVGFKEVAWKNYTGGIAAIHTAKKLS